MTSTPVDEPTVPGGRLLAGRYRIRRLLGRGGMGAVWAAYDEILGREVAIKEVLPSPGLSAAQRELTRQRTMREARAAARIDHPSAVTVYDVLEEDGRPWIVMQLLPSRTLADVLADTGPVAPVTAASIGLDVLDALATAHRAGVLHRDIKPSNVMLSDDGHAVLTDFGIATVEDEPALTTTGMLVGSPGYMSPERARGERPTPASDLWALGATLFAAVEGMPPFRRSTHLLTLNAVLTQPPPPADHAGPLAPLIAALLASDPAERPGAEQARRMLLDAQAAASAAPTELPTLTQTAAENPPPAHSPLPAPSPPPRSPAARRTVLVGVLVMAVAATLAFLQQHRDAATPSTSSTSSRSVAEPRSSAATSKSADASSSRAGGVPTSTPSTDGDSGTPGRSAGPSTSGSSGAPSDHSSTGIPAGFHLHRDLTGFALALPDHWTRSVRGSSVFFREPGGRSYLQVDTTRHPKADALHDWQAQEAVVSKRLSGYHRLRLESVQYRGWGAADWEFTWHPSGGTLHVINRNIRVNDARAYALYWSVPAEQWHQRSSDFDVIARTFTPAS